MQTPSPRQAFTLVELSIVLVILGLLVGGVLAGQSLIRAAELRKTINDMTSYRTAAHTFRDKYLALPGDMHNATNFWNSCTDNSNDASNPCNGNGDGIIDTQDGQGGELQEEMRSFQHLSLAGLVQGNFNGNFDEQDNRGPIDKNLGRVIIGHYNDALSGPWWPDGKAANLLKYNAAWQTTRSEATTEEIYMLDKKLDDGNGLQGGFRIMPDELGNDTTGCVDRTTGNYLPANPQDMCHVWALLGL